MAKCYIDIYLNISSHIIASGPRLYQDIQPVLGRVPMQRNGERHSYSQNYNFFSSAGQKSMCPSGLQTALMRLFWGQFWPLSYKIC